MTTDESTLADISHVEWEHTADRVQYTCCVEFWDVSGHHQDTAGAASARLAAYPDSELIILAFDMRSRESLLNIEAVWLPELQRQIGDAACAAAACAAACAAASTAIAACAAARAAACAAASTAVLPVLSLPLQLLPVLLLHLPHWVLLS